MQTPVLISGAGIAGLTAALTLARIGRASVIQERSTELATVGAGIQLGPNALKLLDRLGLLAALKNQACPVETVRIGDLTSGREIAEIDQSTIEQRYGYGNWCVHRADLQSCLLAAVHREPLVELLMGTQTTMNEALNSKQWAAIIGADGLWSQTRSYVAGSDSVMYTGKVAFRSLIHASHDASNATSQFNEPAQFEPHIWRRVGLWLGAGQHVVHYPVQAGKALNLIAMAKMPQAAVDSIATQDVQAWDRTVPRQLLHDTFATANRSIQNVFSRVNNVGFWPLFDRRSITHFHRDKVCLIGDAAHPMQAHLAQGASMAIEDAFALATCLEHHAKNIPAALAAFSLARTQRCAKAQAKARLYGKIYQASGLTAVGRNWFLKSSLSRANSAGMDWLYRGIDESLIPNALKSIN